MAHCTVVIAIYSLLGYQILLCYVLVRRGTTRICPEKDDSLLNLLNNSKVDVFLYFSINVRWGLDDGGTRRWFIQLLTTFADEFMKIAIRQWIISVATGT